MNNIYDWLFDRYALPKLRNFENYYNDALTAFMEHAGLSEAKHLDLLDMASNMRLEWGAEVFALGVRFGLRLSQPSTQRRKPGWLMNFLP